MTQPWKHNRPAVDNSFQPPSHECYACNDSGIVHNSDGRLDEFMPGYDHRFDKAVVCTCAASYQQATWENGEEKVSRSGFRDAAGLDERIGISCPSEAVQALHEARKASWAQTKIEIDHAREIVKEFPDHRPDFMLQARANIDRTGWYTTNVRGFTSLGDCLTAVVAGIAEGREVTGRAATPVPEYLQEPPEPTAAATPDNDDLFDF